MRKRALAVSGALVLSISALGPVTAHAATASTIYVNDASGSHCSDSGSGTATAPFCTIQAGVDAASAGDTVLVEPGSYGPAVISDSGTAAAPITVSSADAHGAAISMPGATGAALTVSGASYVDVSGFQVTEGGQGVLVENSSHVTVDGLQLLTGTGGGTYAPAIQVTGTSSDVTISRNDITAFGNSSAGIEADPSSGAGTGDVITTNYVGAGDGSGIIVDGGIGTDVTSNTVYNVCNQGIALSGVSTGSIIENNAVSTLQSHINSLCPTSTSPLAGIEVDGSAASGTTLDYNVDYVASSLVSSYSWAGIAYADAADLSSATGQAAHDLNTDPGSLFPAPEAGSNVISSANSDAPGELSTDVNGNSRTADPNVPSTGAGTYGYYDRGAIQAEDPLAPALTLDSQTGTAPATITATESVRTAGWAPVTQWSIDFGDGSAPTVTSTPTTVQHAYAVAGTYTVTLTATDGYGADGRGTSTASATERILSDQVFHPVTPTRILDTRSGTGTGGVIAPVPAKGTLVLKVDGAGPVPASGVAAVTLNLTATNPTAGGNITAYADGSARPSTSNVDFGTGGTVANQVIAQVGSDGSIDLYNDGTGTVDLVADVAGYYGSGAGVGLETLGTPIRILDTRNGSGTGGVIAPVPAKGTLTLTAAETGNLLSAGYTAVLNVTVTDAKSGGYLSVYPDGTSRPSTSSLNFGAGGTVANEVDVQVGSDGSIDFYNNASSTVDVIADQLGMFTTSGGVGYVPISPERVLDTRNAVGAPAGAVAPFGTVQTILDGVAGLPQNLQTVAANVTVTDPTGSGDIEVYPDYLSSPPGVSTLNFSAGATVANATTMSTENNGVDLYNESSGSSQLIMDVFGYYE